MSMSFSLKEALQKRLEFCTQRAPGRVATRAWMILLSERDKTAEEIASIFHYSVSEVKRWIKCYQAEGLEGLYDEPRQVSIRVEDGKLYFDTKVIEKLINEARNASKTEVQQKMLEYCTQMAPGRVATRAWIILLSVEGKTANEIASIFNCHVSTVRRCIKRYQAEGVDGLCNRPQQVSIRQEDGKPYFDTKILEELLNAAKNAPKPKKGYLIES